jgi:hypothetical protein
MRTRDTYARADDLHRNRLPMLVHPTLAPSDAPSVAAVPTAPIAYVADPSARAKPYFDPLALVGLLDLMLKAPEHAGEGFTVRVSPKEYAKLHRTCGYILWLCAEAQQRGPEYDL